MCLFRRNVSRSSKNAERPRQISCCVQPFSQAKIAHERFGLSVEKDITRLQITMQNSLVMCMRNGTRNFRQHGYSFAWLVIKSRPCSSHAPADCELHAEKR